MSVNRKKQSRRPPADAACAVSADWRAARGRVRVGRGEGAPSAQPCGSEAAEEKRLARRGIARGGAAKGKPGIAAAESGPEPSQPSHVRAPQANQSNISHGARAGSGAGHHAPMTRAAVLPGGGASAAIRRAAVPTCEISSVSREHAM